MSYCYPGKKVGQDMRVTGKKRGLANHSDTFCSVFPTAAR